MKNKHFLLLIYDENDQLSQRVLKILESLAKELQNEKDIILGKINVLANDHKEIETNKVPILKFYKAGKLRKGEIYKGDPITEAIKEYLAK